MKTAHPNQSPDTLISLIILGSLESRKTLEPKFIFQIGTLNTWGVIERFFTEISTNTQTLLNS